VVALDDPARVIRGAIVDHHDLDGRVRPGKGAVDRLRDEPTVVVVGDDDARRSHGNDLSS
jgi:hypothetical protein